MAITRLDSDERRQAIVDAAVPLFARKGFAGTTTRELAEAAGISEALLFRHFPSKQLLYREILQQVGCQGDPALEQLASCRHRVRLWCLWSASWCGGLSWRAIANAPTSTRVCG